MNENEVKSTLNAYQIEKPQLACKKVEEMMKHPSTIQEMRETTKKNMAGVSEEEEESGIVFEIAGEGGSIQITRKRFKKGFVYIYNHNESYFDEELKVNKTSRFYDFETPLTLIFERYPVHWLYITTIHFDYKNVVAQVFEKSLNKKKVVFDGFASREYNCKKLGVQFSYDVQMRKWKISKSYKFINEDLSINMDEYNKLFNEIEKSKTAQSLIEIANNHNLTLENDKYPRLEFNILSTEIESLKKNKTLTIAEDGCISINQTDLDPIGKLLFALVWKQGDLQKLRQIINGIVTAENPNEEEKDGLVFYSFGNHIGEKEKKNPIIDQHVVRAVKLYKNTIEDISIIRKLKKITPRDRDIYLQFFAVFKNNDTEFKFLLDRILFDIGKIIKRD